MSVWQSAITTLVRVLIGDLDEPQQFYDCYIHKAIVTGGLLVSREYAFDTTYVFDLANFDIVPDPAEETTYDPTAIALFALKAACILTVNRFQLSSGGSIGGAVQSVQDGDTKVTYSSTQSAVNKVISDFGPCAAYKLAIQEAKFFAATTAGRALISRHCLRNDLVWDPDGWFGHYWHTCRDRML